MIANGLQTNAIDLASLSLVSVKSSRKKCSYLKDKKKEDVGKKETLDKQKKTYKKKYLKLKMD